jgi:ubiquinone/menaquinone biosynthesis C-methylase UbiE
MLSHPTVPVALAEPIEVPANDPVAPDIVTASSEYALRFSGATGAFFLQRQTAAVVSLLDRIGNDRCSVLEVGGGHAQLTQLFLDRGHSVTVHGSALSCFGRIAELEERYGDRIQRLLGSLKRVPVDDASFDVVCSIRLLAHVGSWQELVAEKCRLSRRFVICEFPTDQGVQRLASTLHPLKVRLEPDTRPFTTASVDAVHRELQRHGFRVVQVERQFVLPMALHRFIGSAPLSRAIERVLRGFGITRRIGSPAIILAERIQS